MIFGERRKTIKIEFFFLIVDSSSPSHAIRGRTTINPNRTVASMTHEKLKFPTPNGIHEILDGQFVSRLLHKISPQNDLNENRFHWNRPKGRWTLSLSNRGVDWGRSWLQEEQRGPSTSILNDILKMRRNTRNWKKQYSRRFMKL